MWFCFFYDSNSYEVLLRSSKVIQELIGKTSVMIYTVTKVQKNLASKRMIFLLR